MKTDKRTRARELTMQALYQFDVQGPDIFELLDGFYIEADEDEFVRKLASEWTKGTWENLEQCDEPIIASTIKWQFTRLSPVDKSILRLAVYQLRFCRDIPPKVVINEAIELAKKYSTDKSPAFVNGVLDAILKKLSKEK
ncbi:MAG: transcription antitermination factor NusB [Phycisphaerales bacterium]|jgi:transcription antitermination factor NusB